MTHVVVDGSNLATEGRSIPSLTQLQEAVMALKAQYPDALVTVVVDATFGHRIDRSERVRFEHLERAGGIVSPPAGAVARGDRFLLQIADRTGGTVLSNDSFQERQGEFRWVFDTGRLLGGKPVGGVGWIFSVRTPVRGPASRKARAKQADLVGRAIAEATEDTLAMSSIVASSTILSSRPSMRPAEASNLPCRARSAPPGRHSQRPSMPKSQRCAPGPAAGAAGPRRHHQPHQTEAPHPIQPALRNPSGSSVETIEGGALESFNNNAVQAVVEEEEEEEEEEE